MAENNREGLELLARLAAMPLPRLMHDYGHCVVARQLFQVGVCRLWAVAAYGWLELGDAGCTATASRWALLPGCSSQEESAHRGVLQRLLVAMQPLYLAWAQRLPATPPLQGSTSFDSYISVLESVTGQVCTWLL